jgi:hypothetical protein
MENGHSAAHAMRPVRRRSMPPSLEMLKGGDRRSIGRSNEVVTRVLNEPELFDTLFSGMLTMQSLGDLAERYVALRPVVLLHIKEQVVIGTPAMKARSKKLLATLNRLTTGSTRTGFSSGTPKPAG